ncbi:MAG: hypothetical protein JWQ27_825 [Ferruginibacter sp.]|nr:hypothetical protein [Ferruginibacter sp.]
MRGFFMKAVFIVSSICCVQQLNAQSKEFENVIEVSLERTVTIRNNNTIVGYALFYKVDKLKKTALYRLEILDENLKSIGSNEFEGSKDLVLLDAVYESEHILMAFSDPKKTDGYDKFVKVFDLKGKETGLVSYDPEKAKKGMFGAAAAQEMERYYNGISNIEGKGFVCLYQSKAKTGGADIQMIDKHGKLKWETNFTADKGDRMDLYLTSATPDALIFFCGERENLMSKDSKNFLLGLNPETGKELYRTPMDNNGLAAEPMFFKTDAAGKFKVISTLSHEEDKFYSAKPIGFSIGDMNSKTGEVKVVKNFLFEKDLSKVLDMKNESKSEDGYMQIHNIIPMADGSTVIVGEFFRRTVSAMGAAFKVLNGGGGSASQITMGDMFLLRLDKNNNAVAIEKIEKKPRRIPTMADGLPLGLTQRVMKMDGWFSYRYTDEMGDANKKTVIANGSFEDENYGTSAISFDEKKGYKLKKFTIEPEKKETVYITRAKPGHVMVMKYNSKEKKMTLNLERVN